MKPLNLSRVYVIAEIGINHNGDIGLAKDLMRVAAEAGCQAVKFQKRTPDVCTPKDQWNLERDTPWGRMTYIDYRRRVEFDSHARYFDLSHAESAPWLTAETNLRNRDDCFCWVHFDALSNASRATRG